MIELPKLTGREYRPFDWFGWLMVLLGCGIMFMLIRDVSMQWPTKIIFFGICIISFIEYGARIIHGRVYTFVYYDTLVHVLYELIVNDETYFVCAEDEDDLKLYMELHYPEMPYTITDTHLAESFLKKELYQ